MINVNTLAVTATDTDSANVKLAIAFLSSRLSMYNVIDSETFTWPCFYAVVVMGTKSFSKEISVFEVSRNVTKLSAS